MSSILGILGDLFQLVGYESAAGEEEEYEDRLDAYNRAVKRIEDANRERTERVQRRNQLMGAIGSKNRFMSPQLESKPLEPEPADYDVAEALNTWGQLLGGTATSLPAADYSFTESETRGRTKTETGVDINYQEPKADDTRYAALPTDFGASFT